MRGSFVMFTSLGFGLIVGWITAPALQNALHITNDCSPSLQKLMNP